MNRKPEAQSPCRLRRSSRPVWARPSMRTNPYRLIGREGTSWCSFRMWISASLLSMRWRGKSFPCPTWCGPPIAKPPGRSGPFKSDTPQKCYQYRGCCNDGQAFCCSVGECCSDRRSTGKEVPERAGSRQWGCSAKGVAGAYPPQPPHSLFLTLGGITEKPGVVDGHIAIREYLS